MGEFQDFRGSDENVAADGAVALFAEARQAMIPLRSAHGGGTKTTREMFEKLLAGDGKAALAIYEKAKAEAEAKEK